MLIAKPELEGLPDVREIPAYLLGSLGPAERVALREIAATGDILHHGDQTYIVAAISRTTLDARRPSRSRPTISIYTCRPMTG